MLENRPFMAGDLQTLMRDTPGLREAIDSLLERAERRGGSLPRQMTLRVPPAVGDALRAIFSHRAVRALGDGSVRLDLAVFLRDQGPDAEVGLVRTLYAAASRMPRDPVADARATRRALDQMLVDLAAAVHCDAAVESLRVWREEVASDEHSKLYTHASEQGAAATTRLVLDVVRCLDAIAQLTEPIRVQTFAARALGSSKALRRTGELFRWVSEALVAHDRHTQARLDEYGVGPLAARASALEVNGVLFDEAAASVLCFGPLTYVKQGSRFDQVARHAAFGESSRLVLQQLRDITVLPPPARRITIFENLAPYLDYVDACVAARRNDEIVLCSGGQANLAVVDLLHRLAAHGLPVRHAGDLDRSGVLIARSLMKRSGAKIDLCLMDPATHRRFAGLGARLSEEEGGRLTQLVRADDAKAPGHALLREILATRVWIEQEAFADEVLADLIAE